MSDKISQDKARAGRSQQPPRQSAGSVRIIGGSHRGRKIPVLDAEDLRPTSDRIRETVFNWLNPIVVGARCLDAFAGTGVLGLEARSRGAAAVMLIDESRQTLDQLRRIVSDWKLHEVELRQDDGARFLESGGPPFDIIFLDPPFRFENVDEIVRLAASRISAMGMIYLERPAADPTPTLPEALKIHREKRFGNVQVWLLTPNG